MAVLLAVLAPDARAQAVLGRLVSDATGAPVGEALVLLLDSTRHELARTASTASGGFRLEAPRAGRYTVRVQRIGFVAWETETPQLEPGADWTPTLQVADEAYSLPDLVAWAEQPLCGVSMGNADLVGRLLESAQTALGLAEAAISSADTNATTYLVRSHEQTTRPDGTPVSSAASLSLEHISGWPIRSADPDSLRALGFVQGTYPPPRRVVPGSQAGPVFYGPDARVLFTPWFLAAHCFTIDRPRGAADSMLVVRFRPGKKPGPGSLAGRFEFDRTTLELRVLTFAFTGLPRWVPEGSGGAMRFVRLADGTWLPAWWRMRAPIPAADARRNSYDLAGWAETSGYVISVRRPHGVEDEAAGAALLRARELGPPPP